MSAEAVFFIIRVYGCQYFGATLLLLYFAHFSLNHNSAGTILFSFSLFGKIVGCAMLANAFFNIFILFKYPQYEDAQRNDAQSEIRDYLSSHPAFARQAVRAGTDFVKSNPGRQYYIKIY